MALYALMTALSIFFVMQGLAAFAFRMLLLGAVMWLGWRYAIGLGVLASTDGRLFAPIRRREPFRWRIGGAPWA
jgi:hypothetical protein